MKRGKKLMVLMGLILMVMLAACGKQETVSNIMAEETVENINTSKDEIAVADIASEIETVKEESPESDLNLTEYEQSYEDRSIELTSGSVLEAMDSESFVESWILSDSVNLYLDKDVYIGYTKPNIEITTSKKYDGWYSINVGNRVRYAKADEIEAVSTAIDYGQNEKVSVAAVQKQETSVVEMPEKNESETEIPVVEAPTPAESDKYTPDEAIAVYRSLMEAGGMTWNPSLKNGGSWGTGWIYLDKGYPEECAYSDLESCAMGDTAGNPYTDFYFEVTGSDENAVYITEWAD